MSDSDLSLQRLEEEVEELKRMVKEQQKTIEYLEAKVARNDAKMAAVAKLLEEALVILRQKRVCVANSAIPESAPLQSSSLRQNPGAPGIVLYQSRVGGACSAF